MLKYLDKYTNNFYAKQNEVIPKYNLENFLYSIALKNKIRLDSPTIVGFDVTSRCNLKCAHCFHSNRDAKDEITLDEIVVVLDELVKLNTYQTYIMGGEPFVRDDILNIIEEIKKRKMTISVNTNGTLITEEIALNLSKLLDRKTDWIQISLDGSNEETMAEMRGKGVFQNVIECIKMLKRNNIVVRVNMVVSDTNIDQMDEVVLLCNELNVDRLSVNPMFPYNGTDVLPMPKIEEVAFKFDKALESYENCEGLILQQDPVYIPYRNKLLNQYYQNNIKELTHLNCRAGIYSCEIDPEGNVYPCTFMHRDEFLAGNIRNQSIIDIWKDDSRWTTILDRDLNSTKCTKCEFIDVCKGGCIAASFNEFGTINNLDPRCEESRC